MKKLGLILSLLCLFSGLKAQVLENHGQQLHRAIPDATVDSVWHGIGLPWGMTGKDIIIGFTDWGFDYTHPVFYDTSMTRYRVLRAWDQFKKEGPAPAGFDYGREYVGEAQLLAAQCDTFNVYQYAYHGTHVASIAAGAGAGTIYRGVAYEADLLFATFLVDEQAVVDAFQWMYNVAQQEGKRLVINMSWGLYYIDNYTGTGKIGQKMEELSQLGVVFVTSAGNNGDVNFHIDQDFDSDNGIDTLRTIVHFAGGSSYQYGQSITMTNSPNTTFSFALQLLTNTYQPLTMTPFYNTADSSGYFESYIIYETDTIHYTVEIDQQDVNNHRPEVRVRVQKPQSTYKIGLHVTAPSGYFHAWNVIELTNDVGNWGGAFLTHASLPGWKAGNPHFGLGAPANVECAIAVAAHKSRVITPNYTIGGEITSFSSYGPTIDYQTKPEVSAPGNNIVAALSSFTNTYTGSYTKQIEFQGREYRFVSLSGTSMASPLAAGVVGLVLEANRWLTPQQVKEVLTATARNDQYTAESGVERFGYGKVDAYHAVLAAVDLIGVQENEIQQFSSYLFPNPSDGALFVGIESEGTGALMEVFNLEGKRVYTQSLVFGLQQLNLTELPAGYYMIKITAQNIHKIHKWIKF